MLGGRLPRVFARSAPSAVATASRTAACSGALALSGSSPSAGRSAPRDAWSSRRAGGVSSAAPCTPTTTQRVFAVSGESAFMLNSMAKVSHDAADFSYDVIFQRALLREFAALAGAVFMTLFAIALTTQLVRLLGRAAGGPIPSATVVAFIGLFALGALP